MASSLAARLVLVTVASVLLLIPTVPIEARPERKLCGIQPINWGCKAPNVTADLTQDCSVQEGKKVLKYLNESLISDGWPSLTTSAVLQEYVRVYIATVLGVETCSWYNRLCVQSCAYTCGPCVNCCLSRFKRCQGQDSNDCCKAQPRPCGPCNGTVHAGGRRLFGDDDNIRGAHVEENPSTSDEEAAAKLKGQMTAQMAKGPNCVACATGALPGGSDGPKKVMACASASGEGPSSNGSNDPGSAPR